MFSNFVPSLCFLYICNYACVYARTCQSVYINVFVGGEIIDVMLFLMLRYKWDKNEKHLKPETGLLQLRAGLKVFANLRPATVLPQVMFVIFIHQKKSNVCYEAKFTGYTHSSFMKFDVLLMHIRLQIWINP